MTNRSTIKVKICGMRDAENIRAVADQQPDFMGFIFYEQSPRYVGHDFEIPSDFPDSITKVGVFVNETNAGMTDLVKKHRLDYLQLHGDESVEQVKELSDGGLKIIKVFSVDENFDFSVTKKYQPYCAYFLFDTKGNYYGGNGMPFEWELLKKYDLETPFFLSGGITIDTLKEVDDLKGLPVAVLDVNSGVEVSAGIKDVEKVKQLILLTADF